VEYILPDLNLLEVKSEISRDGVSGKFVIEPLSPGYGVTVGNTLRRILLASLEGYAVRSVKINGIDHEYSTIKGMKEDVVDLILNLKSARFRLVGADVATLELFVKGPKKVTCADFKKNAGVEIVDSRHYLATLESGGQLELSVEIDKGRGYMPVERRQKDKGPVGTIVVDSTYTPVKKVRYDVENARVGGMTDYNRLTLEITTDGTMAPQEALGQAAQIMNEHLQVVREACEKIKPRAAKSEKTKEKKAEKGPVKKSISKPNKRKK